MIKEILLYIFKREAYNSYLGFKNSAPDYQLHLLNKTFKTLLYCLWLFICIYFGYKFGVIQSICIFLFPISIAKCISAILQATKKKTPVYTETPIYKSDKRFKSGTRISHYNKIVTSYRSLNEDEVNYVKRSSRSKLFIWLFILIISTLSLLYLSN